MTVAATSQRDAGTGRLGRAVDEPLGRQKSASPTSAGPHPYWRFRASRQRGSCVSHVDIGALLLPVRVGHHEHGSGDWDAPSVLDHHGPCGAHELWSAEPKLAIPPLNSDSVVVSTSTARPS